MNSKTALLFVLLTIPPLAAPGMEWIRVSDDGNGFVQTESGRPFVPWGFNYDGLDRLLLGHGPPGASPGSGDSRGDHLELAGVVPGATRFDPARWTFSLSQRKLREGKGLRRQRPAGDSERADRS
jgi:hypothetical protein